MDSITNVWLPMTPFATVVFLALYLKTMIFCFPATSLPLSLRQHRVCQLWSYHLAHEQNTIENNFIAFIDIELT